jgi:hypothetical protein
MKAKDLKPNTVYHVERSSRHGFSPSGFDKWLLTGDEIVPVVDPRSYRDQKTKRYVEVFAVQWNYETDQYETRLSARNEAGTTLIALKDIANWSNEYTLDEITADKLESQKHDLYVAEQREAEREANKVRWAAIDPDTFGWLHIADSDLPGGSKYGAANTGQNGTQVTLTLAQIEEINALVTLLKEAV